MQKEKYTVAKHKKRKIIPSTNPPRPPKSVKLLRLNRIWKWLCWVTNNEKNPKHEVEFDIVFFIVNTLTIIIGIPYMIISGGGNAPFATLLIIEYTWALDTLRNNREYI